ncbi:MAG: hypothetical protein M0Z87_00435 [Actinomycetota bacterium]|nr:hypothetical protein [Actinomycetota bacterium]
MSCGEGAATEGRPPAGTGGDTALRVGRYRWVELQLFEILGRAARGVRHHPSQVLFREASYHHAWHVELWDDRLSALGVRDAASLTVPSCEAASEAMSRLASLVEGDGEGQASEGDTAAAEGAGPTGASSGRSGDAQAAGRLAGVYRVVLPRLLVACSGHLRAASPVSDGPVLRALGLVVPDLMRDWLRGESVLQTILAASGGDEASDGASRRVSEVTADMEEALRGHWMFGPPPASDVGCRELLTAPLL